MDEGLIKGKCIFRTTVVNRKGIFRDTILDLFWCRLHARSLLWQQFLAQQVQLCSFTLGSGSAPWLVGSHCLFTLCGSLWVMFCECITMWMMRCRMAGPRQINNLEKCSFSHRATPQSRSVGGWNAPASSCYERDFIPLLPLEETLEMKQICKIFSL